MPDFNFGDLGALTQYFQPTEEDKRKAQSAALMAAGFGMLANNRGNYGALGPALAGGGMAGMHTYQNTLEQAPKDRAGALSQAMTFQKLKKDMTAQELFANMYGPNAGGNTNVATAAPTMNDAGPGMTLPNPAPTAKPSAGPTLQQIGALMASDPERGKAALELWKAQNPGIQVSNGFAYDPRTTQPGFLPQLNVTPQGQAVQTTIGPDGQPTISAPRGSTDTARTFAEIQADQGPLVKTNIRFPDGTSRPVDLSPKESRDYFNTNKIPDRLTGGAPQAEAPAAPTAAPTAGKLNLIAPDDATAQKWMAQFESQGIPANVTVKQKAVNVAGPVPAGSVPPRGPIPTSAVLGVGDSDAEKSARDAAAAGKKEEAVTVGKTFGEQFSNIQKAGFNAPSKIHRFNRLEQLLNGIDTNKLTPIKSDIVQTAAGLGMKIDPKWNNVQAAEALGNEMALELRNPAGGAGMPGSMSDSDRVFLRSMVPGVEKTPEGRKLIINSAKALAQRDQDIAKLASEYRQKNGSIDEGFYEVARKFADANPLFTGTNGDGKLTAGEQSELDQLRKRFKR